MTSNGGVECWHSLLIPCVYMYVYFLFLLFFFPTCPLSSLHPKTLKRVHLQGHVLPHSILASILASSNPIIALCLFASERQAGAAGVRGKPRAPARFDKAGVGTQPAPARGVRVGAHDGLLDSPSVEEMDGSR